MKPSRLQSTSAPASTLLIRIMVGAVFLTEGVLKLVRPDALGVGRFTKIGLPSPEILAPVVGGFEIACGALLLLGLWTRVATVPLITIIGAAIVTTKIQILLQHGFLDMAHEARTDFCMLLGAVFLLVVGAGRFSLDARGAKQRDRC